MFLLLTNRRLSLNQQSGAASVTRIEYDSNSNEMNEIGVKSFYNTI